MPVDQIRLDFSPERLVVLNLVLALLMFAVALGMRRADFRAVARSGKPALIGLTAQFFLLPALTFLLVLLFEPLPSMALGMILVAACPGGNLSNFITFLARGNTALSVSMSAVSTSAATLMTPLNLAFWGSLYPPTRAILRRVALDPWDLILMVLMVLGVPIVLGMMIAERFPGFASRLQRGVRPLSIVVFLLFVVLALAANFDLFLRYVGRVAGLVALHNAAALLLGYGAARLFALPEPDRRAVAVEIGIQNSGLGLVLIFNFFEGVGGMALIAAWWGIWHIISGLSVAAFWSRRPVAAVS